MVTGVPAGISGTQMRAWFEAGLGWIVRSIFISAFEFPSIVFPAPPPQPEMLAVTIGALYASPELLKVDTL